MKNYQIKSRWTGTVIFEAEAESLRCAVEAAVKGGVNLFGADLRGAGLRDANLDGAKLRHAELRGANLRGAGLRGADLRDSDLIGADLRDSDLRNVKLSGADIRNAKLLRADLLDAGLRLSDIGDLAKAARELASAIEKILDDGQRTSDGHKARDIARAICRGEIPQVKVIL